MNISLLISTYNWKEALRQSLLSIFNQTVLPHEILIADDGSTDDTRLLIDEMREISPVPIIHLWQEDDGFRVASIRNKAIARATGDYIVQIDGDIFVNKHFIQDHIEMAEEGYFVCGSRVLLSPLQTVQLLTGNRNQTKVSPKMVMNAIRFKPLRHFLAKRYARDSYRNARGCNMAFWRKDLIAINGYNEVFDSWGPEDKELVARLLNLGIKKKSLKMGGVAFHLHHKELSKAGLKKLKDVFIHSIGKGDIRATNGLDKHLKVV